MCGIFGVINFTEKPVDKQRLISARDIMYHRGPDDEGLFFSQQANVGFGFRRLAIIDLSPNGHQPMTTEDGRFTIVFNGEIYNYKELAQQLISRGIQLKSTSDTEVLLKLYTVEGKECLNKLRGMFAFAIWDEKEKKLFAARDRFGIKPFYYLHNNNEFIFSSELKAIKYYKNGLTTSMEGIDAFLKTGSVPAPLTIYEETKALLPGYWLECKMGDGRWKMEIKQYWSFFDLLNVELTNQQTNLSLRGVKRRSNLHYDAEAKKEIRNSLLDTIKAHMVADVEVGAFLSGGIDSTAIVSLMRQAGHEKIKTISVTFPGNKLDESQYSNLVAKKYETDHHEYRLQEHEIIDELDKIIEAMDQPTIDGINTYFVSKAAASFGLKVVLSGLGGDELLGGYPSFINIPKYQRIKNLPFAKLAMKAAIPFVKNKLPAKAIEYFKNPDAPNAEYKLIRGLFTDAELTQLGWCHPESFDKLRTGPVEGHPFDPATVGRHPFSHPELVEGSPTVIASEAKQSLSPLQYISMMESCVYMRNQLLRDSDVFSMAHSLELRVPFVDNLLYSAVLPYLDDGFNKSFPKKMLVNAVGDLPNEISGRMKMGFTFPFADWMKHGKIKEAMNDSLSSTKMTEYFNKNALVNLQKDFENDRVHWSRVWAMLVISNYTK